jgi:hypothetical protein
MTIQKGMWVRLIRKVKQPVWNYQQDRRVFESKVETHGRLQLIRTTNQYAHFVNEEGDTFKFRRHTIKHMEIIDDE